MQRLGGDVELFREFVEIFREDSPSLMDCIRQGAEKQDGSALARGAHSLKGLVSNFGARSAVDAAKQLEDIGQHHRWKEVPAAIAQLTVEIEQLHSELDQFRDRDTARQKSDR
jgi:HPt (histidine-containing phosphotransfer) domain-containing protein